MHLIRYVNEKVIRKRQILLEAYRVSLSFCIQKEFWGCANAEVSINPDTGDNQGFFS